MAGARRQGTRLPPPLPTRLADRCRKHSAAVFGATDLQAPGRALVLVSSVYSVQVVESPLCLAGAECWCFYANGWDGSNRGNGLLQRLETLSKAWSRSGCS